MSKAAPIKLAKGRLVRQKGIEQSAGPPHLEPQQQPPLQGRRKARGSAPRRSTTDPSSETIVGAQRSGEKPAAPLTTQQSASDEAIETDTEFVLQEAPQRITVRVKLVTLVCCGQRTVWSYRTHGLRKLGQLDLLLLLEHLAIDGAAPTDVVRLFGGVLKKAKEGSTVGDLDHTVLHTSASFLGSSFIGGVLYFMESGQCFHGLVNAADFGSLLVCRLVHKRELPYLVNSPVRLLLRLGQEDGVYPCSLISNRYRPPVFYEPARSLLSMFSEVLPLHDGMVPRLRDCSITLESGSGSVVVSLSGRRQPELASLLQVYAADTDGVLALGSELCQFADAHLAVKEAPGGELETLVFASAARSATGPSTAPAVIGLSFIALASHLHSADLQSSLAAVVEDGVGVACGRDDMWSLLQSLHNTEDFQLPLDWMFLHDRRSPVRGSAVRFVWRHLPGE